MKIRKLLPWVVAAALLATVVGVAYAAFAVGNVDGTWGDIDGVTAGPGTLDVIGGATTSDNTATLYPSAADHWYVRSNATCRGDPDGDVTFADWTHSGTPTWTGLGTAPANTCATNLTSLIISEYVYNQRSISDDQWCIEIYNKTGATVALGSYSVRVYSGGRNSFQTIPLNSTNLANNGAWVLCNTAGAGQANENQTWSDTSDGWRAMALFNENETAGARCNRWATGPGGTPTALSSGDKTVQNLSTTDENQVRYGRDAYYPSQWQSLSCDLTNFSQQSGFGFDGNDGPVAPDADAPFYLGRFTHYNNQVFSTDDSYSNANAFADVDLTVVVPVTCPGGENRTFSFVPHFNLEETSNTAGTCAYGNVGDVPCPDRVLVTQPGTTETFNCPNDGDYTVNILGFQPQTEADPDCSDAFTGMVSTDYVTQEDQSNTACLWASITAPTADIAPVKACMDFDTNTPYYRVIVTNAGPGSAREAKIVDTLPSGTLYSSYTSKLTTSSGTINQGSCTISGQTVTCQLLTPLPATTVDAAAKWTIDLYVTLQSGSQTNSVTASMGTTDTNLGNNTSQISCSPTAVELKWFKAAGRVGFVKLGWETVSEIDNAGFNLYRAASRDSVRTRLNANLIPSQVPPGSPFGAVYTYQDLTAEAGILYFYWLEDVNIYGQTTLHGPVKARAR